MSLTNRFRIKMSERDERVLLGLLHGTSVSKMAENLSITVKTVHKEQRKIQDIFSAKSIIHLIVLAILDQQYYKLLRCSGENHVAEDLTEREVQIAIYILQGFINKEIADLLEVSHRTVEFHRVSFNKKCKVKESKDFVIACIHNGILKITPFEFKPKMIFNKSREFISFKRTNSEFLVDFWFYVNHKLGFVYFDYQNRFVWKLEPRKNEDVSLDVDLLRLACQLSEVKHRLLFLNNKTEMGIKHILAASSRMSYLALFNRLKFFGLTLVENPVNLPKVDLISRSLILSLIARRSSEVKKAKVLGIEKEVIREQEELLRLEFNCDSEVTMILQGLHMGMIDIVE